jgi:hypothetical protein
MCDFPTPEIVLETLEVDDIAYVKDVNTNRDYILTKGLKLWTMVDDLGLLLAKTNSINVKAEWVMSTDDFENGWGEREYPHCSNCLRGVYRHDAGSWCPFCGTSMKNPMR